MIPDPKYLAIKKAQLGTRVPLWREAYVGKHAPGSLHEHCLGPYTSDRVSYSPNEEVTRMTKMAEMRTPSRPS